MTRRCLIVFVKSPDAPDVKTRLARSIGDAHARQLYRCFVPDLLDSLGRGDYDLHIFFHPPGNERTVREWLGPKRSCFPQAGGGLGEKMKNAFLWSFAAGFSATALIGSDFPDLPRDRIDAAFAGLEEKEAVIGPARDGGYYLLGFRADTFLPEALAELPWGTEAICSTTRSILEAHGRRIAILEPWQDIDTVEDLRALVLRHPQDPFAASRTMHYIRSEIGNLC